MQWKGREWCSDWYRPDYYRKLAAAQQPVRAGVAGDHPVIGLAAAERPLTPHDKPRRGDDRDPPLAKGRPFDPRRGLKIGAFERRVPLGLRRGQSVQSHVSPPGV